jgi:D-galactarolactone cycloisomerase
VDANQAYNAAAAVRVGQALADLDIAWFEEPVGATDLAAYQQVKAAVPMPIAGGECLRTRFDFRDFFAERALDIAQPDIMPAGGLTEMRRIADMANTFGILVYPHVWGSPVMIAASLHLASTIPPCPPARQPQPYLQEPVMEFDRTPNPIRETLCVQPITQSEGFIPVPDGPGLGIEIDEAALEQLTVKVICCE